MKAKGTHVKSNNIVNKRSKIFFMWGVFDAFYVAWYCINSWLGERIPYISDFSSSAMLLEQQGGVNFALALASWLLQLSVILSCLMFLLRARNVKYLAYAQIPFRLFFLIPSVSIILVIAKLLPSYGLTILTFIIASEILKAWTLWRFT